MQGKCYYCGKELTERTIKRHMKNCLEMKKFIEDEIQNTKDVRDQFLISIKDKKDFSKYCVYLSIDAGLSLDQLDKFIRDIWVECCEHSRAFYINKKEYSSNSDRQYEMDIHLKDILSVNQKFEYKYDFDLTTSLVLEVVDMIKVSQDFNHIEIIARNNEENAGTTDYYNSPRDGICKYKGNRNREVPYLPQNNRKCHDNESLKTSKHKNIYKEEEDGNTLTYTQQHIDDFINEHSNSDNGNYETKNHDIDNNIEQTSEKKISNDKIEETNETANIFKEMFLKGKYSYDLKKLLEAYPEEQINLLAENINLILPDNLSKASMIEKYYSEYENYMKDIMLLLNNEIYEILYKCFKNNGIINILDNRVNWNKNTYSFLINKGIIFPSVENKKPIFIMPEKMQNIVKQSDTLEFRRILKKNSEIINIFTGMVQVYGIIHAEQIMDLIKRYVTDIDETKILSVLEQSVFYNADYYGILDENKKIIFINNKIENYKEILNQLDKALDYKVFNKQELISTIREDHLKNSSVGKRYIKEFVSMFVMNKDDIVENMKMLALQAQFRDNEEIVKDIINGVDSDLDPYNEVRISNMLNKFIKNIPLWKYKGATINEIEGSKETVVQQKISRNDPCPCGSGKKYKKCCG
ncbi:SEC-C metal-binding domain-containing protein [Clostridium sp. C2-6-12]|uniref:SEC-C metal-binding domain-containing protein n=1 Tax=Clostridium sp. C2-6-12 TaxID=2698832 RepID=UPI00136A8AF7|nr:SEC-C metal-binding domain-containing protein [Clostridium sp. C2-6-12]